MRSVLLRAEPDEEDQLAGELWQQGTVGILEQPGTLRAFFEDTVELEQLIRAHRARIVEVREEDEFDPSRFGRDGWDPILIGNRFFIAPSWVEMPAPPGRMRLVIDATDAFGSGRHESTQLVIEAMESYVQAGFTIVDVGCGSGILCEAARLLGAGRVFGCDIHAGAAAAARRRVASPVFLGSVDSIGDHVADMVLANISAKVIDALAFELKRIAKPGGLLVLAGFIRENPPRRFMPEKVLNSGDWQCWICQPHAIAAAEDDGRPLQPYAPQWW